MTGDLLATSLGRIGPLKAEPRDPGQLTSAPAAWGRDAVGREGLVCALPQWAPGCLRAPHADLGPQHTHRPTCTHRSQGTLVTAGGEAGPCPQTHNSHVPTHGVRRGPRVSCTDTSRPGEHKPKAPVELALGLGHSYPEPARLLWTPTPDVSPSAQAPACSQPLCCPRAIRAAPSPPPGDCGRLSRGPGHWLAPTLDPRRLDKGLTGALKACRARAGHLCCAPGAALHSRPLEAPLPVRVGHMPVHPGPVCSHRVHAEDHLQP